MKILVNAFGISSSGGITVLKKTIYEFLENQENQYYIFVFSNQNTLNLVQEFNNIGNIHFKIYNNYGILFRLLRENLYFLSFILRNNISLIYNFTGTRQLLFGIPTIVKIQNLLFFTKKLDSIYFDNNKRILWLKQIWFKRFILCLMLRYSENIEIQSIHVKEEMSNFINVYNKKFFIKSDFFINKSNYSEPKQYDFSKKIKFLYIIGPHFEYFHKNMIDFINAMLGLDKKSVDFEINITLTSEQLDSYKYWDSSLNAKTNFFGYISDRRKIEELFCDNTILISTSIIETLGLHVIEGIRNGVITITPNESYSTAVYGKNIFQYELFNHDSLIKTIMMVINYKDSYEQRIVYAQGDIKRIEMGKYQGVMEIFDKVANV